jgi:VanZ family protein
MWRALYHQRRFPWLRPWAFLAAFVLSVLYGVADEVHQMYVPERTADLYDVVADGTGALLFVLLYWWRFRRTPGAGGSEFDKS